MTTSIAPLADRTKPGRLPQQDSGATAHTSAGPARGIAMGAALSAPMWVGILYLIRSVAGIL